AYSSCSRRKAPAHSSRWKRSPINAWPITTRTAGAILPIATAAISVWWGKYKHFELPAACCYDGFYRLRAPGSAMEVGVQFFPSVGPPRKGPAQYSDKTPYLPHLAHPLAYCPCP